MRDDLNEIVRFITDEEWDYSLTCSEGTVELRIELFNGLLILNNNGTWSYDAA
jgi:hypothetical protein